MKILLYSDLHISKTSSILPSSESSKYTYRQQMILDTGKYLAELADREKPDIIINLGDTFDTHTITSYDVHVASLFFDCFKNFTGKHYVLVGNHEMINQNFNAIALLNNISNIEVIDEPTTIGELAFLPYCDHRSILQFPEGKYLFSHQDIQGSIIRGTFQLPDGISPSLLQQTYKLVFNGHIHKASISGNVVNVGSISTHSFSDDEDGVPQCYIFDTETLDLQAYRPNICPLFRKFTIEKSISELYTYMDSLDKNYKYVIHCVSPFDIKDTVKLYLDGNENIISSRLNVKTVKEENNSQETVNMNLQANVDLKQSFIEFLSTVDLKYPINVYTDVLKEVI